MKARAGYAATVVLAAALLPYSAHAQQANAGNAGPAADETGESDIVVTAQRRSERLQDVPISVTALSGATIAARGIQTTEQLGQVTPGLLFSRRGGYGQPVIRGIATNSVQAGDEASVAIYIDGVYISQMASQLLNLTNIKSLEVLKGPQGTLFGRNATGGAINITTRDIAPDPTLEVSGSYGTFNERIAKGYASTPLGDTLAMDVAGFYRARGNYLTDIVADARRGKLEEYGGRSKLKFQPNDRLSFVAIGDISYSDNPQGNLTQVIDRNTVAETLGFNTSAGRRELTLGTGLTGKILKQRGLSLQAQYDAGLFDLISISAYRHSDSHQLINNSGTAAPLGYIDLNQLSTDYSQEFRVVSTYASALQWVAGAFYFNNKASVAPFTTQLAVGTPIIQTTFSTQRTEAYAVFVDATLKLTEHFSLTGGVRYSDEARTLITDYNGKRVQPNGPQHKSFAKVTPRAILSYKPTSNTLVYGSYSQGFKSGVFNPNASTLQPPVNQSVIDAFEVGVKQSLRGFGTINGAVFDYDYKGLQVSSQVPGGGGAVQLQNAASARIKGAELSVNAELSRAFQINVGVSYLDAKYHSFPLANVFIPLTTAVPGRGNLSAIRDVSGNYLERSPKWTVSFAPRYTVDLGNDRVLDLSSNLYYSARFFWEPLNRVESKAYVMLNAQADLALTKNLSVAVFGNNLTNAKVYSTVGIVAGGDRAEYLDPRTIGLRVAFKL